MQIMNPAHIVTITGYYHVIALLVVAETNAQAIQTAIQWATTKSAENDDPIERIHTISAQYSVEYCAPMGYVSLIVNYSG